MPVIRSSDDQSVKVFILERFAKVALRFWTLALDLFDRGNAFLCCPCINVANISYFAVILPCKVSGHREPAGIHTHSRHVDSFIGADNIAITLRTETWKHAPKGNGSRSHSSALDEISSFLFHIYVMY